MAQSQVDRELEAEIQKGLDDAIDALRWARRHLHDRRAAETIKLVQMNLSCLALALEWHMEGEDLKAAGVTSRLWWNPHKDEMGPADNTPTGH